MDKKLNIKKGTISFWIKKNKVDFADNKEKIIFNTNPQGGGILINKDENNFLNVMFVVIGKGRIDLSCDVSDLDPTEKHMIALTWDLLDSKKITLYLDGSEVDQKEINFNFS